jgi:hypothetical protein
MNKIPGVVTLIGEATNKFDIVVVLIVRLILCKACTLILTLQTGHWPRSLRQEMSSPTRTLAPWVRVPLIAWISVRFFSLFVLSYVVSGLPTRLITRPKSPTNYL